MTILSRENVGYASTCNTVGQYLGFSISYVVFLALNSEEFCNTYIRDSHGVGGIVTLPGFLYGWGFVFLVVTTALPFVHNHTHCSGKRSEGDKSPAPETETAPVGRDGARARVAAAYRSMWAIIRLPSVLTLGALLLTSRIGLATDALLGLKLVEKVRAAALMPPCSATCPAIHPDTCSHCELGTRVSPRTSLPYWVPPSCPWRLLCQWWSRSSWWGTAPSVSIAWASLHGSFWPYHTFCWSFLFPTSAREGMACPHGCTLASFSSVYPTAPAQTPCLCPKWRSLRGLATPRSEVRHHSTPCHAGGTGCTNLMRAVVAGTYMTLLNTLANLGGQWPAAVTLRAMGALTTKTCEADDDGSLPDLHSADTLCHDEASSARCAKAGGHCRVVQDGFVPIVITSLILGTAWVVATWRTIDHLQQRPLHHWRCLEGAEPVEGDPGDEEMSLLEGPDTDDPTSALRTPDSAQDVPRRHNATKQPRSRVRG